ncbi:MULTISPECIES: amino acid aminotransferase [unclassified Anaerobiospirillum]|uniref:amino acid aminotransferase n=1 Tax=unclassified Anaerobiospirillum TaxID=2647410 RepID=UPI001FF685C4|nr:MULTISPECIES: amino acid aminotransferase [unclassified Anaerobiospirillum]MCK0534756.1 aspartate/tyrosine/aromatic aminotransferase [Anaerobiospirillum sp. NML120511]MCK0539458.1 aspartate/tyrosine/aromatic aminotransferase [Anaerobiospirillum sp. NML02-A-032]
MFFDHLELAPADPILGLTDAFKADTNPKKVNLGVGVYQDETGVTPVLKCVKEAEKILVDTEVSKSYLPISGLPEYGQLTRELLFGRDHALVNDGRAVTCHCPGGTGALRIAADFIYQNHVASRVWISDPTWGNHFQIVEAAGLKTERYPYYDRAAHALAFDRMLDTLEQASEGDVVIIHACCHNPTGIDPTKEQWDELAAFLARKKLLPLIDFAYQGFGEGIDEDAYGLRKIVELNSEVIIASSYSKNFGMYNERVGALTCVAATKEQGTNTLSQIKLAIRCAISNPPAHGEKVVITVLSNPELRAMWEKELAEMRVRMHRMRTLLAQKLKDAGAGDFDFIVKQNGMFSFSGLSKEQVDKLRAEYGIYIVGSGRMCVAGINDDNVDYLADAIAKVVKG